MNHINPDSLAVRMPAEYEPHEATWLSWPHEESDWPGKFECIRWVYGEIVRHLAVSERVEILCHNEAVREDAEQVLRLAGASPKHYRMHLAPSNRSWVRDSGPTGVYVNGELNWVDWRFNAWAKYDNYAFDNEVPKVFEHVTGSPRIEAFRDDGSPFVTEGGAIEVDGEGTLLVTEECFLSDVQVRNPGFSRADYERTFRKYLGTTQVIWLGRGIVGDDTHGHIDDVARFVGPARVLLAFEEDPDDENHELAVDNKRRLELATDARGRKLDVRLLPMPKPLYFDGYQLPASYANFYIGNSVVIVPTFNDPNDRVALNILAELFPDRRIVGIGAVDLVLGLGTLHCLSQQQPLRQSHAS